MAEKEYFGLSKNEIDEFERLKTKKRILKERKELENLREKSEKNLRKENVTYKIGSASQKVGAKTFSTIDQLGKKSPTIKTVKLRVPLTPQQNFFRQFMGGRKTFGTGQNLPVINGALTTGGGLINHPNQYETGRIFGFI